MKRFIAVGLLALTIASCAGGTETGNPAVPTLGLQVWSSDPKAVAVSQGAGGTVIEEAWVSFGEFIFLGEGECGDMTEFNGEAGPTLATADLAQAGTRIEIELEAGAYCGLVVPLKKMTPDSELPEGAPQELSDHSIVVKGHRSDSVRFTLAYPEQEELELLGDPGPFSTDSSAEGLLLSFDVSIWMEAVDLDRAQLSTDGTVRIDEQHNPSLLEAFEMSVECALGLYRDTNRNWTLDEGEPKLARCAEAH